MKQFQKSLIALFTLLLISCNSGSSGYKDPITGSKNTISFNGEVEQGDLAANLSGATTKNTPLAGVEVCALGACTTTDQSGAYLLKANNPGVNGAVEFTLTSPKFSAEIPVSIKSDTKDVEVIFLYDPNKAVTRALEVEIDGAIDPGQSDGSFNDGD